MLDKRTFEKAVAQRAKIKVPAALVRKVDDAYKSSRGKFVPGIMKEGSPELCAHLLKVFGKGCLRNRSVILGVLNLRTFCHCGVEITLQQTVACSSACRGAYIGRAISAARKKESPEDKAARTEKIKETKRKRFGEDWAAVIGGRISAAKKAIPHEQKLAVYKKVMKTLEERSGIKGIRSVYELPGMREQLKKRHKEAIPRMLKTKEATMMARYGVRHQAHLPEFHAQKFKNKQIKIGRKTFMVQGFEEHVLRYLIAREYKVKTKLSGIPYTDAKGIERMYFADIAARKGDRHLLVEVKSTYTFKWARANCPEKYFAGTRFAQDRGADYLVFVVAPGKAKMAVFCNPFSSGDLLVANAKYIAVNPLPA